MNMALLSQFQPTWMQHFLEKRALWISSFPNEATDASSEQANFLMKPFCPDGNR
jgi:predicted phosphoadenosine phosphosulfate sulfurtransferase